MPCNKKPSKEKEKDVMIDPKHLVAKVVNETVKWIAVGLLISAIVGGVAGFLISLYFR